MSNAALDRAPEHGDCGVPTRGAADDHGRMCVVCRRKAATDDFVPLKQVGIFETQKGGKGRGAHVCIALACLRQVHQKTLDRAFKTATTGVPMGDALLEHLHSLAQGRMLGILGLARRCGELVCGTAQVERYLAERSGFFLKACDLAPRSAGKLAQAVTFLDGEHMGQAVGMGYVGAMGIRPGRLARQAAYWLRLWYETELGQRHQLEKPIEVA